MYQAAHAYSRAAQAGETPRDTEAAVLIKAAARFQAIRDAWDERQTDIQAALTYNRRIWTILLSGATAPDNPLPQATKQGINDLAVFILKRTLETMTDPAPAKLDALISINRNIAAGLRGSAASAPLAAAA